MLLQQQAGFLSLHSGAQWRFFQAISARVLTECRAKKSPAVIGRGFYPCSDSASGDQSLACTLDHGLQRLGAGVLIGIQAFTVASNTVFVDDGEAEAAFASGHDQAVHWGEGVGQCMDSVSLMSSHD
jgi:hypothetical protein